MVVNILFYSIFSINCCYVYPAQLYGGGIFHPPKYNQSTWGTGYTKRMDYERNFCLDRFGINSGWVESLLRIFVSSDCAIDFRFFSCRYSDLASHSH